MYVESYSPINNKVIGKVEESSLEEIELKVRNSRIAQVKWNDIGLEKRLEYLIKLYKEFEKNKEDLSNSITLEMGMPITFAREDIDSGLNYMHWYLDNGKEVLKETITYEDETQIHKVFYEPKGVVVTIVAWNFPFSNFIWQVMQNLIVGNTVVLKHSEYTILVCKKMEEIISTVLPKDVLNVVYGDSAVGEMLVNQDIDLICFTGSSKTGEKLYKVASEKFIPVLLELGGSACGIVCEDIDVDSVIDSIYFGKFYNSGQVCDGLKRLLVQESKFDEVTEKLKNLLESKKTGNPLEEDTDIGTIVSKKQLETLESQFSDAISKGAKVICGGSRLELDNGNYFLPTLITNISKDMLVYIDEVFGTILPVISFKTIDEAIEIANDTKYGLGGYVFTKDMNKFKEISSKLKTGMVTLNNLTYVMPCNPFGGYKKSGLGRNHGEFGFKELCNIKVVTFEK